LPGSEERRGGDSRYLRGEAVESSRSGEDGGGGGRRNPRG
jgi:hypothetical protein